MREREGQLEGGGKRNFVTQEGGTCRERVKGRPQIDLWAVKRKKKLMT